MAMGKGFEMKMNEFEKLQRLLSEPRGRRLNDEELSDGE